MIFGFKNPHEAAGEISPENRKKPDPETVKIVDEVMDEERKKKEEAGLDTEIKPDKEAGTAVLSKIEKELGPDVKEKIIEESGDIKSGLLSRFSKNPRLCGIITAALLGTTLYGAIGVPKAEARMNAGKAIGIGAATGIVFGVLNEYARQGEIKRQREIMQEQQMMMREQRVMQNIDHRMRILEAQHQQALNNINRARNPQELEFAKDKLKAIKAEIEEEKMKMGR